MTAHSVCHLHYTVLPFTIGTNLVAVWVPGGPNLGGQIWYDTHTICMHIHAGGCCHINDVCHRSTHCVCGHWTDLQ